MELQAAIEGLLALDRVFSKHWRAGEGVVLVSDSKYTLGSARGIYDAKTNLEQVAQLNSLYRHLCTETRHVRGHRGDPFNERCDKLAKMGKALFKPIASSGHDVVK